MRDVPAFATYFLSYELAARACTPAGGEVTPLGVLMAGGLAGVASWLLTYPVDVIKTRLQCDSAGQYTGFLQCARASVAAHGYSSLTRGLAPTLLRAFPTNAATFAVVSWTLRLFPEEEEASHFA